MLVTIVVGILCALLFGQPCRASGEFEIEMESYSAKCEDNIFLEHPCDTYFYICIDKPGNPPFRAGTCYYKHAGPSTVYENNNHITFYDDVGGLSNPFVVSVTTFQEKTVKFSVKAIDDELFNSDELIGVASKTFTLSPHPNERSANWNSTNMSVSRNSYSFSVRFKYRAYCDAFYYTSECDVHCKARNDTKGHYMCHPTTGKKQCLQGWTGNDCNTDIDECLQGPCFNNAPCTNRLGSYECRCSNGFIGQNCDLIHSMCYSSPCQHGGTCSGTMSAYNCSCPDLWTGENCQTEVDFCQSSPCQNNGTCHPILGHYTCECPAGWLGDNCEFEVNACDYLPCEHHGICTNLPHDEYECRCTEQFEGENCEKLKNPCDARPCLFDGKCIALSHKAFKCFCGYRREGDRCEIPIGKHGQTQKEKTDWLPIVLACLAALILVAIILILLYVRRRRRQKTAMAEDRLEAPCVAANGGGINVISAANPTVSFQNHLYEQTNRSNAQIDLANNNRCVDPVCQRPPMPLPAVAAGCGVPPDEVFYPVKPGYTAQELQGAVGGVAPGTDTDAKTCGGEQEDRGRSAGNDYADFGELHRRSVASRQASERAATLAKSAQEKEETGESHYHDLDDVYLNMQIERNGDRTDDVTPAGTNAVEEIPERLESTDDEDEDEGVNQEDLDTLRREVLQRSTVGET